MVTTRTSTSDVSYVEWSPVFAGTVVALAISIILVQFGSLVGLEAFEPTQSGEKTRWLVVAAAGWLFWSQLMASMAGGFLAGRLRSPLGEPSEDESELRDGAHGLLVWATATVIAVGAAALFSALGAAAGPEATASVKRHADIAEDVTRNAGIVFGFVAAAGSLVSGVAAAWMAKIGGDHRDKAIRFNPFNRPAKKRK